MERSRAVGALISFTPPQEYFMRKQVSRLCFILLGRLPALMQWLLCPFVRFTVTGVARNFHPYSLGGCPASASSGADAYAIHLQLVYGQSALASMERRKVHLLSQPI